MDKIYNIFNMNEFNDISNIIKDINNDFTTCMLLLKKIKKKNNKLQKILNKKNKKKNQRILNKKGITKKKNVPKKLCYFFNLDSDILMSRIEITKKIYKYVKDNNLKYNKDKRIILPDKKLRDLFDLEEVTNKELDIKDKKILSVYTLQTYIKKCYE